MQRFEFNQLSLDFRAATAAPEIGCGNDTRKNFSLFVWWIDRKAYPVAIAALILGVDVRTVNRWRRERRVPRAIAMHIDQAIRGPIIHSSLWRGNLAWRYDWREKAGLPGKG